MGTFRCRCLRRRGRCGDAEVAEQGLHATAQCLVQHRGETVDHPGEAGDDLAELVHKQRDRGLTGGQLLMGMAAAQLVGQEAQVSDLRRVPASTCSAVS